MSIERRYDPKHQASLKALLELDDSEIKTLVSIVDYRQHKSIASEVLASLIRMEFGKESGLFDAITATLHQRVIKGVQSCLRKKEWVRLGASNSELVEDAAIYFWEKFIENEEAICNAEVRFGIYLQNRVVDYFRSQLAEKNTILSIDKLETVDKDGKKSNFVDSIPDTLENSPEMHAIRTQDSSVLMNILIKLPKKERNAFYFRAECKFDWNKIAKLIGCSVPTARKLFNSSLKKLQGAIE